MKNNDPIATFGNYRLSYRGSDEPPDEGNAYMLFIGLTTYFATTFSLFTVLARFGMPLFLIIFLAVLMLMILNPSGFLSAFKITSIKHTKPPKPNFYYQYTLAILLSGFGLFARYLSHKDASPTLVFYLSCVAVVLAVMYYAHVFYALLFSVKPKTEPSEALTELQ